MGSLDSKKLWLGNLPSGISEVQLRSIFGPYGVVERLALFPSRGYAFVFFRNKANAAAAAAALCHRFKIEFEADVDNVKGFRFLPSDKDLVGCYLYNRVTSSSSCSIINDCDLYGNTEPWELWEAYGGDHLAEKPEDRCLYFFTRLKKKSTKGSRIERRVGKAGTWRGEDTGTEVAVDENIKGLKKRYKYEGGPPEQEGCWYMIEFSLVLPTASDVVLCRLRKNEKVQMKNAERKRKLEEAKKRETSSQRLRSETESSTTVVLVPVTGPGPSLGINQFEIMETAKQHCSVPTPPTVAGTGAVDEDNFVRGFLNEEAMGGETWVAGEELYAKMEELLGAPDEVDETLDIHGLQDMYHQFRNAMDGG